MKANLPVSASHRIARLAVGAVLLAAVCPLPAAGGEGAKYVPADTFMYLSVRDVNAFVENFKKTRTYALYKDPAMQQFVVPAEKKVRELIDEKSKQLAGEIGLEQPPAELPWPQGTVVFAMRMVTKTITLPEYDWSEFDPSSDGPRQPKLKGTRQIKRQMPLPVILADMGNNAQAAAKLIGQLEEKAVEKGQKRQTETVRGVEIHVLTPAPPKRPEDVPETFPMPEPTPTCWAMKDGMLIVAPDLALTKDVVALLAGSGGESLADSALFKSAMKAVAGPTADMSFYLDIKGLVATTRAVAEEDDREEMNKVFGALGVDAFTCIGAGIALAPSAGEDMRARAIVGIRGARTGLAAVLTPLTQRISPPRLLTKGLASFIVANYDMPKIFDQIVEMTAAISGQQIDQQLQQAMAATGGEEGSGQPPVDLRKEVIGQLAPPLTYLSQLRKPYTDPESQSWLLALGVRDAGVLNTALERIHSTFIAPMGKELQREINDTKLYLIPAPAILGMFLPMMRGARGEASLALAVAGDNLVLSSVSAVEQAVRDVKAQQLEGIASDPMYQHAAKLLPAQAGAYFYENQQITAEALWQQIRQAAKEPPPRRSVDGPALAPIQDFRSGTKELAYEDAPAATPASPSGASAWLLVKMLRNYVDFSTLPEFEKVSKYFGATIGYAVSTDDGILVELIDATPPQK